MASVSDNAVAQLVAMGFDAAQGKLALGQTSGNLEQAVNLLLSGSPLDGGGGDGGAGSTTMVVGTISQYSVDQGRSACTCIALTAASKTLENANITPDLLQSMITEGVQHYQSLSSSSTSSVEHMSAKQRRKTTPGTTKTPIKSETNALKRNELFPGSEISVDHFQCNPLGRRLDTYGKEKADDKYKGGIARILLFLVWL